MDQVDCCFGRCRDVFVMPPDEMLSQGAAPDWLFYVFIYTVGVFLVSEFSDVQGFYLAL